MSIGKGAPTILMRVVYLICMAGFALTVESCTGIFSGTVVFHLGSNKKSPLARAFDFQ